MNKLRLNDEVIVTAGSEKGKKGKILKINAKTNRVVIEGVKILKKSVKPTQENPNGGFAEIPGYIHISNISLVSPKTGAASRVRIVEKDGKKIRVLTKCNTEL
jgi:large subunit ribosomal protein L24